jgi:hypothetical protein
MRKNVEQIANQKTSLFFGASSLLVVLLCSYVFFLNSAVRNVVQREKFAIKIAEINSKLSDTESNYIVLKNGITLDLAYSLGFQTVQNPVFVSRSSLSKALSVNSVE